jgi:heterodisulfide reductase subunit A
MKKKGVLVVGGGIAGLEAALDLAALGIDVYLLDKEERIGGRGSSLSLTALSELPARLLFARKVAKAALNPRIHIISSGMIKEVKKDEDGFLVSINKEPTLVNDNCISCGACSSICPIKTYSQFNEGLSWRSAVDREDEAGYPPYWGILQETPPCSLACPAGIDVRRYVSLIAEGKYDRAIAVVREANPLPSVCGRVCPSPCETACSRGLVDEPIAIEALKRFVADYELALRKEGKFNYKSPPEKNGFKVAMVGSGPAGLTCAHDLTLMGYQVVIFEREKVAGGMLYLGIPEFRLPRDVLAADIEYIEKLGVEIRLNTPIGPELSLDDLFRKGFSAVFIASGAYEGYKLGIPGENDYRGVEDCIRFLRRVNLGKREKPGDKVVVIGGGNSAVDAARVSLRLGAAEVTILYRRSRKEMPANPWEVVNAEQEGVRIHFLAVPVEIIGEKGRVVGMKCIRMKLGKLDASGRRRPIPMPGSEFTIDCDFVVPAISQQPDISFLGANHGLKVSRWNSIEVDPETMATDRPGVFAGGDVVSGPATVVEAIAAGHRAALGIDRYLKEGEK